MLPKRINKTQLFPFMSFFLFSQEILQNGLNASKMVKIQLFPPLSAKLRNYVISHKIKKVIPHHQSKSCT